MPPERRTSAPPRGHLRIIGGTWRGRRVEFRADPGLRPTPDRVRETAFNWLQPVIAGSRCLDLFCGSGALALEALSRGAAAVTMVDSSPAAVAALRGNLARLGASGFELVCADAFEWLASAPCAPFDIAFVDPPFGRGLAARALECLAGTRLLAPGARIYVESAAAEPPPPTPPDWTLHRDKRAGQVAYRLYLGPEHANAPTDL